MKRPLEVRGFPDFKPINVKFFKKKKKNELKVCSEREHSVSGVSLCQLAPTRGDRDEGCGRYFEGRWGRQGCRPTTGVKTYSPGPLALGLNVGTPVTPKRM